MASITTEIKNTMASHLQRRMFGMEIYGQHRSAFFDGKENRMSVIEVKGPSRFERHGVVILWHPHYGKWQATLLSEHHTGKPVQVLTADAVKEYAAKTRTSDFIYEIYQIEAPECKPVVWDTYWEAQS